MIQMADTCFQEFRGSPQQLTVMGGEGRGGEKVMK